MFTCRCLNKAEQKKLERIFKLLSDQSRLSIFCQVKKFGPICVCDIARELNLKQNLVSHHLKELKSLDLISVEKKGKHRFYQFSNASFNRYVNLLEKLLS